MRVGLVSIAVGVVLVAAGLLLHVSIARCSGEMIRLPRALAVSPDGGMLWIATDDGLWSFAVEGETFTRSSATEGVPSEPANAVVVDSRGAPWVGTSSGVAWLDGKSWRRESRGLPSRIVLSILKSRVTGALYAGTDRGIAVRYENGSGFLPLLDSHEFSRQAVLAIAEEPDGRGIWFARERAVERLDPDGGFDIYQKDFINPDRSCPLLGRYPRTVAVSPEGAVWIPTEGGINILVRGPEGTRKWTEIPVLGGPINSSRIPSAESRAIAFGLDGTTWLAFGDARIADGGLGLLRLAPQGSSARVTTRDGLPSNRVHALAVARDGTVWAATSSGLARLRDGRWRSIPWW